MSNDLFGTMPEPLKRRWDSPGDAVRVPQHKRKNAQSQYKREKSQKDTRRPNPFRERIADKTETEFRHEHWQQQRDVIRAALASSGATFSALSRWDNCGAECLVEWSQEAQRYRLKASYCKSRHCRPCAKARANLIALNLKNKLAAPTAKENDRFRFVTLTLRHSDAPLKDQIDNLHRHFRLLRSTKFWKKSQRGGCAMIEIGLNERGEWHPHLHIVSEGDFLRQSNLANEWMRITGGSFKVDVRAIKSGKDVGYYVAKYVTKGTTDNVWLNASKAQEYILATKGLRTCATYGTWRGFQILKHDPDNTVTDWKPVGLLSRISDLAYNGCEYNARLLVHLMDALQYDPSKRRQRPAEGS